MKSTIQVIREAIETDDVTMESQEPNLQEAYKEKNIDDFLIALCGWSWKTIQTMRKVK